MLKGLSAVVTGSTSGIGLGIARVLASEGVNLVINGFGDAAAIEAERVDLATTHSVKVAYTLAHTKPLVARFKLLTEALPELDTVKAGVQAFIDALLPDGNDALAEHRALALAQMEGAETPADLLAGMMQEITQPDIPPTVEEVRLMSLHKSKGLSSPYVFVAGCVEGILPPAFDAEWSKDEKDAALEEARRLFYVGITRVKVDPENGRPGSLFISYLQQMTVKDAYGANVAFKTQSGAMANLLPSRFLNELGPTAPKAVAG